MGNQQSVKEPKAIIPNLSIQSAVPSSIRSSSSRSKPRVPKDSRIIVSNIFTEHNGKHLSIHYRRQKPSLCKFKQENVQKRRKRE